MEVKRKAKAEGAVCRVNLSDDEPSDDDAGTTRQAAAETPGAGVSIGG